jgi:hypothetical protein
MTNHIHLAIQVGEVPLSRIMQNITFRYTKWINWRQKRSGHLFQGRFKAILVDADSYLLELTRYIHRNPVRANMVQAPEDYPWSGHRAYLGLETIPWLTADWVLSQFDRNSKKARLAYRQFVEAGKDEGHVQELHNGSANDSRVLGGDDFINNVLTLSDERPKQQVALDTIIQSVCLSYEIEEEDLRAPGKYRKPSEARGIIAWLILETGGAKLSELGRRTGRDVSTLSSAAKAIQLRAKEDHELADIIRKIKENLI